jgi:hypothetical protein
MENGLRKVSLLGDQRNAQGCHSIFVFYSHATGQGQAESQGREETLTRLLRFARPRGLGRIGSVLG